jgi:hypothetical protein
MPAAAPSVPVAIDSPIVLPAALPLLDPFDLDAPLLAPRCCELVLPAPLPVPLLSRERELALAEVV